MDKKELRPSSSRAEIGLRGKVMNNNKATD
jgi:hypothetical protein